MKKQLIRKIYFEKRKIIHLNNLRFWLEEYKKVDNYILDDQTKEKLKQDCLENYEKIKKFIHT